MRAIGYALAHALAAVGFIAAVPGLTVFEAGMWLKRRIAGRGEGR